MTGVLVLALHLCGVARAQELAPASLPVQVAPVGALGLAELPAGGADVPRAEAIRSSDGSYTLTLVAPLAWTAAEVQVAGTDAVDLGPATADQEVRVSGWTSKSGPLFVTLRVATPERVGVTWQFWVDAQLVPGRSPALERSGTTTSRRKRRSGR